MHLNKYALNIVECLIDIEQYEEMELLKKHWDKYGSVEAVLELLECDLSNFKIDLKNVMVGNLILQLENLKIELENRFDETIIATGYIFDIGVTPKYFLDLDYHIEIDMVDNYLEGRNVLNLLEDYLVVSTDTHYSIFFNAMCGSLYSNFIALLDGYSDSKIEARSQAQFQDIESINKEFQSFTKKVATKWKVTIQKIERIIKRINIITSKNFVIKNPIANNRVLEPIEDNRIKTTFTQKELEGIFLNSDFIKHMKKEEILILLQNGFSCYPKPVSNEKFVFGGLIGYNKTLCYFFYQLLSQYNHKFYHQLDREKITHFLYKHFINFEGRKFNTTKRELHKEPKRYLVIIP